MTSEGFCTNPWILHPVCKAFSSSYARLLSSSNCFMEYASHSTYKFLFLSTSTFLFCCIFLVFVQLPFFGECSYAYPTFHHFIHLVSYQFLFLHVNSNLFSSQEREIEISVPKISYILFALFPYLLLFLYSNVHSK